MDYCNYTIPVKSEIALLLVELEAKIQYHKKQKENSVTYAAAIFHNIKIRWYTDLWKVIYFEVLSKELRRQLKSSL